MNNHDALLRAICEAPFNTTPRRVYADLLDDRQETIYCPTCKGSGARDGKKLPKRRRVPDVVHRMHVAKVACPTCCGKQSIYTDAERATFIRESCDSGVNFYPARMGDRPPFQYDWPAIRIDGAGGMVWNWIGSDGFVSRVSVARIEDVLGGECYQCDGTGVSEWSDEDDGNTCLVCRGERRLPDRSALWLTHPIIDVRFSGQDAYPFPDIKPNRPHWLRGWTFSAVRMMWSSDLPVDLFNHMPRYGRHFPETRGIAYTGSGDTPARIIEDATAQADEALSRGVVNLARHRCGLSRIIWPGEPGYNQTETEQSPKSEIPKIFS